MVKRPGKWSNEKRPRGLLLRSPSLERAEKWVKSRPSLAPPPTAETHEFIARSRADARARVVRIAVAGIAAVFLSGLAIVYTQYTLDNEAYAEAREINADLGIQPEQALSNRQRNALWRLASASKTVRQKLVSIILDGDDQTVRNFAGLSFIMRALGPLADADQEKFVNAAIAAIQRNRDPQALLALSTGLAAIPVTLTDDRARRALEPILKRIKELWVDNRELIVPLAHAVGALAPKLPPAEAQQALKAVVDEIAPEEPRFDGNNGAMLDALAAALKAIPGELTSERAQKALHPTIELSVLRALAPKLPSSLAQQAAQPLIQKLRNSQNPSQLWDLLRTIGALNVKLDDEQRGWVLDTILPQMAQTTDLESLASVLATIGEGLNAPQAEDVCKTLLEKADSRPGIRQLGIARCLALPVELSSAELQPILDPILRFPSLADDKAARARELGALAPKLRGDQARQALDAVLHELEGTIDPYAVRALVRAVGALWRPH